MSDNTKSPKTIEQLETEIVGLKIRLRRVEEFIEAIPTPSEYVFSDDDDNLLEEAEKVVQQYDRASASLLQRRLTIGYARAARIIDQLEAKGVLAPSDGSSKPREVLLGKKDE